MIGVFQLPRLSLCVRSGLVSLFRHYVLFVFSLASLCSLFPVFICANIHLPTVSCQFLCVFQSACHTHLFLLTNQLRCLLFSNYLCPLYSVSASRSASCVLGALWFFSCFGIFYFIFLFLVS